MDPVDVYMTIGSVAIPAAVAAYELGYPLTGTALCIVSGVCMLLAGYVWTRQTKRKRR